MYLDLKEDFLQSDLPYFVDVVDLHDVAPEFKRRIEPDFRPVSLLEDQLVEDSVPFDKLREECGVMAVYNHPDAARLTYWGAIFRCNIGGRSRGGSLRPMASMCMTSRAWGWVSEIFTDDVLAKLPGHLAIGHTRYSTTGDSALLNAQPISVESTKGLIAIAHNGNLTNLGTARERAGARWGDLSDNFGFRDHHSADCALALEHADRLHGGGAWAGRGRVLDRDDDAESYFCGARSAWVSAALHGTDRGRGRGAGYVLLCE